MAPTQPEYAIVVNVHVEDPTNTSAADLAKARSHRDGHESVTRARLLAAQHATWQHLASMMPALTPARAGWHGTESQKAAMAGNYKRFADWDLAQARN